MPARSGAPEDNSTRREIIHLLRTRGPMTVADLGQGLGITHVAVRRHLTTLERDALVQSTLERQPMGRPTRVYSLTEAAEDLFPKKYGNLSVEMLDFMAEIDPELTLIDRFFDRRKQELIQKYGPHVEEGSGVAERVARLTEIQTANGYLASCESTEDPNVFYLKEFNCPVHSVSRRYDQACHHELEFFKQVLGTDDIVREECIAKGGTCCRYRIATADSARDTAKSTP